MSKERVRKARVSHRCGLDKTHVILAGQQYVVSTEFPNDMFNQTGKPRQTKICYYCVLKRAQIFLPLFEENS